MWPVVSVGPSVEAPLSQNLGTSSSWMGPMSRGGCSLLNPTFQSTSWGQKAAPPAFCALIPCDTSSLPLSRWEDAPALHGTRSWNVMELNRPRSPRRGLGHPSGKPGCTEFGWSLFPSLYSCKDVIPPKKSRIIRFRHGNALL